MKHYFHNWCKILALCVLLHNQASPSAQTQLQHSVWDELRQQFSLNHELQQPTVQKQIRWLVNHPRYLQKLTQSEPYIYHIISAIKQRHMPGEIALIPMVESAYNPFAYSVAGAAGLWQLMPGTGNDLGLQQDWWYDGRRSIPSSTDAALTYLSYLYQHFNGQWILAFAAYDAGENAVTRIIKRQQHSNFWTLPLPSETQAYVPRILALAEIIQNPERYHIQLPYIPLIPYFEEVEIGSQLDLSRAAKLAEMSYQDLIKLNPGYNRWRTGPYHPYKLLIPVNHVMRFHRNLALLPNQRSVDWSQRQIHASSHLSVLAGRYHATIQLIKMLNQLNNRRIHKGEYVLIPKNTQRHVELKLAHFKQPRFYKTIYIVTRDDSLSSLEKKFHVSSQQIQDWNRLNRHASLHTGQSVIIWKRA